MREISPKAWQLTAFKRKWVLSEALSDVRSKIGIWKLMIFFFGEIIITNFYAYCLRFIRINTTYFSILIVTLFDWCQKKHNLWLHRHVLLGLY